MIDHERAFPSHGSMGEIVERGMTLRDYFAAAAMQTMIGQHAEIRKHTLCGVLVIPAMEYIPPMAYEYADAMLAARDAT